MSKSHIELYINWLKKYYYGAAIVVLFVQYYAFKYILPLINSNQILAALLSGTVFIALFRGLIWAFENWGWKYFVKPYQFEGKWYVTFTETQKDSDEHIRYGLVEVSWSDPLVIEISGRNFDSDGKTNMTLWDGVVESLSAKSIRYSYKVNPLVLRQSEFEG